MELIEQRVIELFHRSIEAKMNAGESLAPQLVNASQYCVERLLEGRKLLCAGNGASAAMASILCQNLLHQYRLERPGLAAICLSAEAGLITGIGSQNNFNDIFSRQVKTLGESGDLLVLFSTGEDATNLCQAVHAAHERGVNLVAFTASDDHNLRSMLDNDDLDICIDNSDVHRIQEVQLLSVFALCDLIDEQLFGEIN